ncbi:hypothetical protein QQF64_025918 [Cirrhinus molitorella]|uniref:DDE Tnp4 domain-containing protein n=1 Tax=Cirrhinus molitorella TaxID=172907 RepID=A0ABR3NQT5_9TELE
MSESSRKRTERMKSRDDQQKHAEAAEVLQDIPEAAEKTEQEDNREMLHDHQDAECQTDLSMDDIERMEDVLKHTTAELGDLRTKALDTPFSKESFQKNEDLTKFYTGLPNFLVLMQIPAFTKGKRQLSADEVEQTREIANVRIHVERVIGLVRRKYQILQSRAMPIEHMAKKPGESMSLIDKIGVICCALSNLSESVVPLE